eukprot:TRINITY_DN3535_c0_g1_i4.p1 TRINITY_DN3535_c0_g1~~TRINITY_DN3535_c0_g1_i4.p1  ORF type:complete len:300 (-),score=62.46 TRINITY_DN3535_c0_g1_i4:1621-2520(-)
MLGLVFSFALTAAATPSADPEFAESYWSAGVHDSEPTALAARDCPVMMTAHRGATYSPGYFAPENTFASTEEAARLNANFVEFDVHTTQDGVYVLLHDDTLDRTTNCTGSITSVTYAWVRSNCIATHRFWDGPVQHVPTLTEGINWAKNFSLRFYVDLKRNDQAEGVVRELVSQGFASSSWLLAGNADTIRRARSVAPELGIIAKTSSIDYTQSIIAEFVPTPDFQHDESIIDPEHVALIHSVGSKVFMNAVGVRDVLGVLGAVEAWTSMVDGGVDVIQTDFPGALYSTLVEYCGQVNK